MAVSRHLLANAIATRLLTVANATGYYGQVGRLLPGAPGDTPLDPPVKSEDDPRVQPYFVLYPGAGAPSEEQDLALMLEDLTTTLQVTVAGGDVEDVLALVDRVDAALLRWTPEIEGVVCGFLRPPPGYEPRLLPDRTITPHRQFVPLQYELTATT